MKEGEFTRLLETQSITKLIAQESDDKPLKFHIVGINAASKLAYAMRHGRTDQLRTWRLDNLAKYLELFGVRNFEVQFNKNR